MSTVTFISPRRSTSTHFLPVSNFHFNFLVLAATQAVITVAVVTLISAVRYQVKTVRLNLIMVIDLLFYNSDESDSLNMRDSFSVQPVIEKTHPLRLHEGLLIKKSLDGIFFQRMKSKSDFKSTEIVETLERVLAEDEILQ